MKIVCSWCGVVISGSGKGLVSHGICPTCLRDVTEEALEASEADTVADISDPWFDVGGEAGGA